MHLRQPHLRTRVLIGALAAALSIGSLCAQSKLTVSQFVSFIQSSIKLKQPDKQVAAYLDKLKLSERLDARTIEDLQGQGAGPATVEPCGGWWKLRSVCPGRGPKVAKPTAAARCRRLRLANKRRSSSGCANMRMNYSKNLPNFICTQVTRRYFDRTGQESVGDEAIR